MEAEKGHSSEQSQQMPLKRSFGRCDVRCKSWRHTALWRKHRQTFDEQVISQSCTLWDSTAETVSDISGEGSSSRSARTVEYAGGQDWRKGQFSRCDPKQDRTQVEEECSVDAASQVDAFHKPALMDM